MNEKDELDRLLSTIRAQAPDAPLGNLEPHVWQRIAARAAPVGWASQLRWQGTAVALAMSLGAAFGSAAAARLSHPSEMAVFTTSIALAPSTILDGAL